MYTVKVMNAPVVQWIGRRPPEPEVGVRFPSGALYRTLVYDVHVLSIGSLAQW